MDNPKLLIVSNIIDSLPHVLFNVKCFNFLNKVELEFASNSCVRLQAFTTDNEDVLLVELANTEGLSWLLEAWEQNPLLA